MPLTACTMSVPKTIVLLYRIPRAYFARDVMIASATFFGASV